MNGYPGNCRPYQQNHAFETLSRYDRRSEHFVDAMFRHHGLPENIVLDREFQFTSAVWTSLFELLSTRLQMSTAAHPKMDGQNESIKGVL